MTARIITGDCREVLATMAANSIDACVTDPPYGLEFMGKEWDRLWNRHDGDETRSDGRTARKFQAATPQYRAGATAQAWHETWAREVYRVLKPGGHMLAFGGTRTHHRLMCAIEDAGFEVRDCLMWVFGSGFPKSLSVSKQLDKTAGVEREVVGVDDERFARLKNQLNGSVSTGGQWEHGPREVNITAPATDLARQWDGWGTALKPAYEPIVLARKPLSGSVAANVTAWGVGGLNIAATRIGTDGRPHRIGHNGKEVGTLYEGGFGGSHAEGTTTLGRWPANLILDAESSALLDELSGESRSTGGNGSGFGKNSAMFQASGKAIVKDGPDGLGYGDSGGASRYFFVAKPDSESRLFYTAKASRTERNKGLAGMPEQELKGFNASPREGHGEIRNSNHYGNHHPTVKPVDLMQWLVRLITPKGGTVLDCFCGSGTTGIAADREGMHFIGIEQDPEYAEIARKRFVGDCPLFAEIES